MHLSVTRNKLPKNGVIIFDALQDILEEYPSANEGSLGEFQCFEETESETELFRMSIITLLIKRVYKNGIIWSFSFFSIDVLGLLQEFY